MSDVGGDVIKQSGKRRGLAHLIFEIGVLIKGVDGVAEVLGGVLLLLVSPESIGRTVAALTQHELSEDPRDFIASHLLHAANRVSPEVKVFAAVYLLAHGLIKVLLVWALLRSKRWAYPTAIAVFGAFGVYQMYRYVLSPSFSMSVLTVLDVFVIALTWNEYRQMRRAGASPGKA